MTVFSPKFQPAVYLIYGILKQVQNDCTTARLHDRKQN